MGRDVRAPVHARVRRDVGRPRPRHGRRPQARRDEPRRVLLPAADHARRPSGFAVDRRAAPAARLLSGIGRRRRDRRHQHRARARPAAASGPDRRRVARRELRAVVDEQLLPRGHQRPAGDGLGRAPALGAIGPRTFRCEGRDAVRRVHADGARAAGGVRVLRPRRGERLRQGRRHRDRWQPRGEHERRPARRGVHPRDERDSGSSAPGAPHGREPDRRPRARDRDRRDRGADERRVGRRGSMSEAQEEALRAEARAWLEANFVPWRESVGNPARYNSDQRRAWHRKQCEGGWGAPSWPVEYGGKGFGPVEYAIWAEEKARIGANIPFNVTGFGMAGPTIIAHATERQKKRYLPPLLAGDEIWCQLFSEPGAGSDLAALTTRATRDGDGWVVTGQKVWSSSAHEADFGILLARYDFDKPKHEGLIYFIVDMHSPGIEVRPLRQISGESEFNEVFLSDVHIPDENRIGEPGDGWRVAMTTLMFERMSIGSATGGYTFPFERLVALRSEEHTSELQSRRDLVCRLLLEKK